MLKNLRQKLSGVKGKLGNSTQNVIDRIKQGTRKTHENAAIQRGGSDQALNIPRRSEQEQRQIIQTISEEVTRIFEQNNPVAQEEWALEKAHAIYERSIDQAISKHSIKGTTTNNAVISQACADYMKAFTEYWFAIIKHKQLYMQSLRKSDINNNLSDDEYGLYQQQYLNEYINRAISQIHDLSKLERPEHQEIIDDAVGKITKIKTNSGNKQSMQMKPQLQTQMQEEDSSSPKKASRLHPRMQAKAQVSTDEGGESEFNANVNIEKPPYHLNIVDVSAMIDLFAEQKALEEFDEEMATHASKGLIRGLIPRWINRVGRGAKIQAHKAKIKQDLESELALGNLTIDEIKNFVRNNESAIYSQSFLSDEQDTTRDPLDQSAKLILQNNILKVGLTPQERQSGIQKLRSLLQTSYTGVKIELGQLERAIADIESALVGVELDTLKINLNLYDSGRIGDQKGGNNNKLTKELRGSKWTQLMDLADKKILNFIKNPTFAAVASAVGVQALFGRTLASFAGGLVTGSLVGGALAGGRATQESRDHIQTALRAYAHNSTYQANSTYQKVIGEIITTIDGKNTEDFAHAFADISKSREEKEQLATEYYARRLATRDTGYNFLLYPDTNATGLNVTILQNLNALGLGRAWSEQIENRGQIDALRSRYVAQAEKAQTIYLEHRKKHALKQGAIYGGSALAVGGALGAIQYGAVSAYETIMGGDDKGAITASGSASATLDSAPAESVTPSSASGTSSLSPILSSSGNINGGHQIIDTIGRTWLDNGTAAPRFEGNELGIHMTSDGGFDISSMIGQSSSFERITDLIALDDQSTYAIVTVDGIHYRVDISPSGILIPDEAMGSILAARSFDTLEIAHQNPDGTHNIFATLKGDASGAYIPPIASDTVDARVAEPEMSTGEVPNDAQTTAALSPETTTDPIAPSVFAPFALPIGGNRYHEGSHSERHPRDPLYPPPSKPFGPERGTDDDSSSGHSSDEDEEHQSDDSDAEKIALPSGTFMGGNTPGIPRIPYLPTKDTSMHTPNTQSTQQTLEDLKNEANQYWDEIIKLRSTIASKTDGKQMFSETDLANMKATEQIMLQHYHDKLKTIKAGESVASNQQAIKSTTQSLVSKTLDLNKAVGRDQTKKPDTSTVAKTNESADADRSIDSLDQELSTLESQLRGWFVKNRIKNIAAFADNLKSLEERKKTLTEAQQKEPGNTNITGDLLMVEQGLKEYDQIAELLAKKRTLIEQYRDKAQKDAQYAGFLQEAGLTSWEEAGQKLKKLQTKKAEIDGLPGKKKRKEKAAKKLAIFEEMIKTHQTINDINKWIGSYDQAFGLNATKKAESSKQSTEQTRETKNASYDRYLDINAGSYSLRLIPGESGATILLQKDGEYVQTSLDDLLKAEKNSDNHHIIRTQLKHFEQQFRNGAGLCTKNTSDTTSSSDTTKSQDILKITQLLPEVITYQERIKVNHNFYMSTGDRTYLRFNEEILKDIARAEGKSADQYEIKDGLIIRK